MHPSPDELAKHISRSEAFYTLLRERAALLGGDTKTVNIYTEELLAWNRTQWRPRVREALSVVKAQPTSRPPPLTLGIMHASDFKERRRTLAALISSVRDHYPLLPILVAYDGAYLYEPALGASDEEYIRSAETGLAAGRNTIVANVQTEFVMIVDDDVEFHHGTQLGTLVAHLRRDPALALVAACYHPSDCYAYNLNSDGVNVRLDAAVDGHSVPVKAQLVQNAFVARTAVLRRHAWDARQHLMEHESFFAALANSGVAVGFDPRVTVLHHHEHRNPRYFVKRHQEAKFLQYLCRNFPRLRRWQTPSFSLDCPAGKVDLPMQDRQAAIAWDDSTDYSTVVYQPPNVTCFIIIPSAQGHVPERDMLRRGWLGAFHGINPAWDYGFFTGGEPFSKVCTNIIRAAQTRMCGPRNTSISDYAAGSNGACRARCECELTCHFYSYWQSGGAGWCVTTPSCTAADMELEPQHVIDIVGCAHAGMPSTLSGDAIQMFGDVVRLPVPDDYAHLGEKVLAALQWTADHVEADYVLKVDLDTWVDADLLVSWLLKSSSLVEADAAAWYGGMVPGRAPVLRRTWFKPLFSS